MKKLLRYFAYVLLLGFSALSQATILQDIDNGNMQVDYFEPIGQSFITDSSAISFSFYYDCINCGFANSDNMRLSLREGDGLGGSILSSVDFNLANNYEGYYDIDFSDVGLSIGSSYTATLEVLGDSPFWGVRYSSNDVYGGGQLYVGNSFGGLETRFRVLTVESVPAPASLALLGLGLVGLGYSRRKKN